MPKRREIRRVSMTAFVAMVLLVDAAFAQQVSVYPSEIPRMSITAFVAMMLLVDAAVAQQVFVYPKKGQSVDQQARDQSACAQWAKSNSGVDPSAPPPPPDRGARRGSTVGGAARGAAMGAAAGSVVGGAAGRRRGIESEQAGHGAERNAHDRAFAACMESRDYTVR